MISGIHKAARMIRLPKKFAAIRNATEERGKERRTVMGAYQANKPVLEVKSGSPSLVLPTRKPRPISRPGSDEGSLECVPSPPLPLRFPSRFPSHVPLLTTRSRRWTRFEFSTSERRWRWILVGVLGLCGGGICCRG